MLNFTPLLLFSVRCVLIESFIHLSDSSRHRLRKKFKYTYYVTGWVIEHSLCFICQSDFWKSCLLQKVRCESSCSRWSFSLHASNRRHKKDLVGVNAIIQKWHVSSSVLLTNVHLLFKDISLNCHQWGTKPNFPPRGNDSKCFIKQNVKPEIKILDNILCSCEMHKKELLLKVILSHLCMKLNTPADLFHLEKVFPSFRLYYADLLWNWDSFLLSLSLIQAFSVSFYSSHVPSGLQEYLLHFVKEITIMLHFWLKKKNERKYKEEKVKRN